MKILLLLLLSFLWLGTLCMEFPDIGQRVFTSGGIISAPASNIWATASKKNQNFKNFKLFKNQKNYSLSEVDLTVSLTVVNTTNGTTYLSVPGGLSLGYHDLTAIDGAAGLVTFSKYLFVSDDCPQPNSHGVGVTDCVACEGGEYCPGGNRVWPRAGHWRYGPEESGVVTECTPASRCVGGRDSLCAEGNEGYKCAKCSPGYYILRDTCEQCQPSRTYASRFYYVGVCGSIVVLSWLIHDKILVAILSSIMTLQIIAAVGKMASSAMPRVFRSFYSYMQVLNIDFEGLRPGCSNLPNNTSRAMFFGAVVFVAGMYAAMALGQLVLLCIFKKKRRFFLNRAYASFCLVVHLFYYIATTRSLSVITCFKGVDGKYRMVADESVVCWQGSHIPIAAVSCLVLVAFTLGIPYLVMLHLERNKAELHHNPTLVARFGIFFEPFFLKNHLFGLAIFFVDLMVAVADAVLRYMPIAQVSITAGALLIYVGLLIAKMPFKNKLENLATILAYLVALFAAFLNFTVALSKTVKLKEVDAITQDLAVDDSGQVTQGSKVFLYLAYVIMALTCLVVLLLSLLVAHEIAKVVRSKNYLMGSTEDDDIPPERLTPAELGADVPYNPIASEGGTLQRSNSDSSVNLGGGPQRRNIMSPAAIRATAAAAAGGVPISRSASRSSVGSGSAASGGRRGTTLTRSGSQSSIASEGGSVSSIGVIVDAMEEEDYEAMETQYNTQKNASIGIRKQSLAPDIAGRWVDPAEREKLSRDEIRRKSIARMSMPNANTATIEGGAKARSSDPGNRV
jgi:hypothetical protein